MRRSAALIIALAMCSCSHSNGTKKDEPTEAPLGKGVVTLQTEGRTLRVDVEVARTPAQREKGLMFRKKLKPYQGMLFVFDNQKLQSFWMKNTYVPLDMIFIANDHKVVGVVENAAPMTKDSRRIDTPSRYVLEVRGGFARAHGVRPGTTVKLELD